jgi:hypothetical protein
MAAMTYRVLVTAVFLVATFLPLQALLASAEDDLVCGQAKVIRATIRDAAGNPVSDRTRVEFITNHGGVLAGTGVTLDPLAHGYVQPLSSTIAETLDGVATVTLITSTNHIGPYEVVISAGSWNSKLYQGPPIYTPGSLTPIAAAIAPQFLYQTFGASYPITAQVTVTCKVA